MGWLSASYELLRGLHIIAVIAWMAGFLILPRLFVYQMNADPGSRMDVVLQAAQLRLMRLIMNPAMASAWLFGLLLIGADAYSRGWGFLLSPWMLVKFSGVLFLTCWHEYLNVSARRFAAGTNTRSERYWRLANELPFVAAIVMVLAVTTEFRFG